jgi:hypothetical protein
MRAQKSLVFLLLLTCTVILPASAVPLLQLYIAGATYDVLTETWVTESSTFDLWVIGNVEKWGPIADVHLAMAFYSHETGSVTFTRTYASDPPGDPSLPPEGTPAFEFTSADGEVPIMNDGQPLPPHGVYGVGRKFHQYSLGDFDLQDSLVGDYIDEFPNNWPNTGQVNAYTVAVTGYSAVHFDVFNGFEGAQGSQFGPFSHDAVMTPEPASLVLLLVGAGLASGSGLVRRRRRNH